MLVNFSRSYLFDGFMCCRRGLWSSGRIREVVPKRVPRHPRDPFTMPRCTAS